MIVPNASVTIARYGPVTRNAGNASTAPKAAVTRIAIGSVAKIGSPNAPIVDAPIIPCPVCASTPAVYAPMPNRPACPSDT